MTTLTIEQIRSFRLWGHHLDRRYPQSQAAELAGACGMQNTPPGAWETTLYNRAPDCGLSEMEQLLYREKTLLQTWSLRGAPVVFPVEESDVFLAALAAQGEPWIYTAGIALALDFLQMEFEDLLALLQQVMPLLEGRTIVSKSTLDQTLADWIAPLLPADKGELWASPSMYGSPGKPAGGQTVGGAVVSFLLRPCSFGGLVVFGEREGISPTFASYKSWIGRPMQVKADAPQRLVRKYLHCYGPATPELFAGWLGCSGPQARRLWQLVSEELEPVRVLGKTAYILSADRERLLSPVPLSRELLLLGGHDPFLDQRDRLILQPDKALHRQIWQTVSNPGVVVWRGEAIGTWAAKKKPKGMELKMTLWRDCPDCRELDRLAQQYAVFRGQPLLKME